MSNVNSLTYTASSPALTLGVASVFKVSAVNIIGEGALSIGTTIIAATEPSQPLAPTKLAAAASWIQI